MLVYYGGKWVKAGTYWKLSNGECVTVPGEGGVLPGGKEMRYLRKPLVAVAGPLMGLLFLIFLPFIGIVVVASLAAYRLGQALKAMGRAVAQTVVPIWKPGEAHLARGKQRQKEGKEDKLAALEKEIETKKQNKK